MPDALFEIAVIFVLLLVNAGFAMQELALVSANKMRLRALAEKGNAGAAAALKLTEDPSRLLSTVQIGITLVGIFAGAFGGATLAGDLEPFVAVIPWVGAYAHQIAFLVVVASIAYGSLIIGELVPKRLALVHPEGIAVALSVPMLKLAQIASPIVALLTASTNGVLRILRVESKEPEPMTEEEMMVLLREGAERGMLHEHESRMAGRVLELDQLTMSDVMTPRTRVVGIDVEEPHEAIWHKIVVSDHSQFPVYEGSIDNIVGIVSVKSYYANLAAGVPVNTRDLMRPAFFVPRTMTLLELINELRTRGQRLAIVLDEFGGVSGTVALRDVLASIVGDMSSDDGTKRSPFLRREDGSVLIDAIVGIDELNEYLPELGFTDVDQRGFQTLAGYICHEIGGLPQEGDHFIAHGFRFEVMDMDRLRVDKVLVQKVAPPAALP